MVKRMPTQRDTLLPLTPPPLLPTTLTLTLLFPCIVPCTAPTPWG